MFSILKRKKSPAAPETPAAPSEPVATKAGIFARISQGLAKTRSRFTDSIGALILGKKTVDAELLETIETQLLTADVGVDATALLIKTLTAKMARKELADPAAVLQTLKEEMKNILLPCQAVMEINDDKKPFVILVVGINGAGKTTTIGKLAKHLQIAGEKVMLAAGDTFRAAAVEQLQVWGERNNIPVISQQAGADTAAVIYDALESATARAADVLIADTAGRLHTQANLMAELKKVKRVIMKIDATAPHETLLVLDASIGQNALIQAVQFHDAIGVTGLALTKLDGTAKGGIIFAIAQQLKLPIRYIGIGEGIDDLRPFNADEFVNALFETDSHD
jgi:fused signal recognition particle receptor